MATVIQIKRTYSADPPTTAILEEGELAYSQDSSGNGANANLGNFRLVNAIGQALYFGCPSNPTAPIEIGHLPKGMYKLVWENPLLESQTLILQ